MTTSLNVWSAVLMKTLTDTLGLISLRSALNLIFFYLLIENIEISYLSQHFIKMTKQWKNAADVPLTSPSPICCFSL